jgi:serine/threonine protein kinase
MDPGTRLGRYEMIGPLGQGGMGTVYRARDLRLGRVVALKILRQDRAAPEARLLATVNHPAIAIVYDVGEADAVRYLVMELVPGQTLAQRLRQGAVPVEGALEIGRQIADALAAAHDQGIIHRDLKPGNVMLTPEGKVKVLDFGLARSLEPGTRESYRGELWRLTPDR